MIYNILKKQNSETDSLPNSWKLLRAQKQQYIYTKNYQFYNEELTLPGTNVPVLFSNDRILKDSRIVTSDNDKTIKLNDPVFIHDYAPLLPLYHNIWKATPRKIKN